MDESRTPLGLKMSPTLMASIVRGAFRSDDTNTYFGATIDLLRSYDRNEDATAVTYMRELYRMGEIEILMRLRAQWLEER